MSGSMSNALSPSPTRVKEAQNLSASATATGNVITNDANSGHAHDQHHQRAVETTEIKLSRCTARDVEAVGKFAILSGDTARISMEIAPRGIITGKLIELNDDQVCLEFVEVDGKSEVVFKVYGIEKKADVDLAHLHLNERIRVSILVQKDTIWITANGKNLIEIKRSEVLEMSQKDLRVKEHESRDILRIGKDLNCQVFFLAFVKNGETILKISAKDGDIAVQTLTHQHVKNRRHSDPVHESKKNFKGFIWGFLLALTISMILLSAIQVYSGFNSKLDLSSSLESMLPKAMQESSIFQDAILNKKMNHIRESIDLINVLSADIEASESSAELQRIKAELMENLEAEITQTRKFVRDKTGKILDIESI
jgi:hypothetical protein